VRLHLLILLGLALSTPSLAVAEEAPTNAVHSTLTSGHQRGEFTLSLRGGWPRLKIRAQVGAGRRLAPLVELEVTPEWRLEPSLGLGISLAKSARGGIAVEVLAGWHLQYGTLAQRGPSGVVRIRGLLTGRVVGGWFAVGTRHTLLFDRTTLRSSSGTEVEWTPRHRWSPHIAGGVAFNLHPRVGLEVGLNMVFVDVEVIDISLPGFHASLIIGIPEKARP